MRQSDKGDSMMLWAIVDLMLLGGVLMFSYAKGVDERLSEAQLEVNKLESLKKEIEKEKANLETAKKALDEQLAKLGKDLQTSDADKNTIAKEYAAAQIQLANTVTKLNEMDDKLKELNTKLKNAELNSARAQGDLATAKSDLALAATREKALEMEKSRLKGELNKEKANALALENKLTMLLKDADGKLSVKITEFDTLVAALRVINNDLNEFAKRDPTTKKKTEIELLRDLLEIVKENSTSFERTAAKHEAFIKSLRSVPEEVLGLKSRIKPMKRVAIVIDTSGSMGFEHPVLGNRWDFTKNLILTWLEHLAVEEAVVIQFGAAVTVVTDKPVNLKNKDQKKNLLQEVATWKPGGGTPTLEAMTKAYSFDDPTNAPLDAILLFTDGAPDGGAKEIADVCALARKHDHIPINAIAVGDYFSDRELSNFLIKLSTKDTKGSFQGR